MDTDERDGCRSLVCDIEGIIVAEMVYRCMICASVSSSTIEAREHYHQAHMQDGDDIDIGNGRGLNSLTSSSSSAKASKINHTSSSSSLCERERNAPSITAMATLDEFGDDDEDDLIGNENGRTMMINDDELADTDDAYFHYYKNVLSNCVNNFYEHNGVLDDTGYYGSEESSNTVNRNPSALINNFTESSISSSKLVKKSFNSSVNRGNINTNNANVESCTRSGYITCPVCTSTRYYTTLQRRYGQFTCVACYRFFKEFFTSPRQYVCPNLGSCSLDVKSRCKACWLNSCLKIYTIDSKRRAILESFKPVSFINSDTPISLSPSLANGSIGNEKIVLTENNNIAGGDGPSLKGTKNLTTKLINGRSGLMADDLSSACDETETMDVSELKDEPNIGSDYKNLTSRSNNNNTNDNDNHLNENEANELNSSNNNIKSETNFDDTTNNINLDSFEDDLSDNSGEQLTIEEGPFSSSQEELNDELNGEKRSILKEKVTKTRVKNWCCLQCANCLAEDCGQCINCLDRPKFGGRFVRKQRCINRKCLRKSSK